MNVYNIFIHNCQNSGAAKLSLSRWKDSVVHPHNKILFSAEKKCTISPWKDTAELWMLTSKWKKPVWEGYIRCGSNSVTFCKRQTMENQKDQQLPDSGGEKQMNRQSTRFLGQWKYSVWSYNDEYVSLYFCLNPRIYNAKSEPLGNLWTLGDYDVFDVGLSLATNVCVWWVILTIGKTMHVQGGYRSYMISLCAASQFFIVNLKLL